MARFSGRCVVITGAGTGIGLATSRLLAAQGAHIVMAGRDATRGEREAAAIRADGGDAEFVATDVADDAQVADLAVKAAAATGRIDLWFGNAGGEGPIGAIEDWPDAELTELLAVNVKGILSGLKHASAHMQAGGQIINTASFVGAHLPVPIAIPYGATKAAVVAASQAAAIALGERGISVLSICPWIIDTPMVDRLTGGAGTEAKNGFAAGFAPSGKLTPPEHVAEVVADLWDGTRPSTNGAAYLIDAGPTVTPLTATPRSI